MKIDLIKIKPTYMAMDEVSNSGVYLQDKISLQENTKYLIEANSGHGKSSILNVIYGSNTNYDGTVLYDGKALSNSKIFDLRKNKLSYVFQDFKLFEDLTAYENIVLKNKMTNYKTEQEIDALIDKVGLSHKRDSLIKTLSLGQRQRIAIIRALCQPFELLLLDEPFSHLDETNIKILVDIITKETEVQNASIIMTALGKVSYFNFDKILNL